MEVVGAGAPSSVGKPSPSSLPGGFYGNKVTSGTRNTPSCLPGAPWPVRWGPQTASRDQVLICLSHSQCWVGGEGPGGELQAPLRKGEVQLSLEKQLLGSGADRIIFPHHGPVLSPPCLEPWFPTRVCGGACSVGPPHKCLACFSDLEQTLFASPPPLLCAPSWDEMIWWGVESTGSGFGSGFKSIPVAGQSWNSGSLNFHSFGHTWSSAFGLPWWLRG